MAHLPISDRIKYPIYIISKGRFENPLTAKFLLKESIPFQIAVEPQEFDQYSKTIPREFILKLPFSNLGLGSFPARNHCWEDSLKKGFEKHHLLDDNIYGFMKLSNGVRSHCSARLAFSNLEIFSDRYSNLALSGFNYSSFITKEIKYPFVVNTHVYSGILINNKIPFRWRLKYNEDVDLSLQALHNGYCTVLLNVFTIRKVSTTTKMKGGNQTELYQNNNHQLKALKSQSLQQVWPQYVNIKIKYNRPHHQVSWKKYFKQPLQKKIEGLKKDDHGKT